MEARVSSSALFVYSKWNYWSIPFKNCDSWTDYSCIWKTFMTYRLRRLLRWSLVMLIQKVHILTCLRWFQPYQCQCSLSSHDQMHQRLFSKLKGKKIICEQPNIVHRIVNGHTHATYMYIVHYEVKPFNEHAQLLIISFNSIPYTPLIT